MSTRSNLTIKSKGRVISKYSQWDGYVKNGQGEYLLGFIQTEHFDLALLKEGMERAYTPSEEQSEEIRKPFEAFMATIVDENGLYRKDVGNVIRLQRDKELELIPTFSREIYHAQFVHAIQTLEDLPMMEFSSIGEPSEDLLSAVSIGYELDLDKGTMAILKRPAGSLSKYWEKSFSEIRETSLEQLIEEIEKVTEDEEKKQEEVLDKKLVKMMERAKELGISFTEEDKGVLSHVTFSILRMSKHSSIKDITKVIEKTLSEFNVKHTHALELVANVLGYKNRHVALKQEKSNTH